MVCFLCLEGTRKNEFLVLLAVVYFVFLALVIVEVVPLSCGLGSDTVIIDAAEGEGLVAASRGEAVADANELGAATTGVRACAGAISRDGEISCGMVLQPESRISEVALVC